MCKYVPLLLTGGAYELCEVGGVECDRLVNVGPISAGLIFGVEAIGDSGP